jgi:hypothetical protein
MTRLSQGIARNINLIKKEEGYFLVRQRLTQSVVRLQTSDKILREAFWKYCTTEFASSGFLSSQHQIDPRKQQFQLHAWEFADPFRQQRFIQGNNLRHVCHRIFWQSGNPR